MGKLFNRAKMQTTSTGTSNLSLGSSVTGFVSFADAGVNDGDLVRYCLEDADGTAFEIGLASYATSGLVLTRTDANVQLSSNSNNRISLSSGTHIVFITAVDADFQQEITITVANSGSGNKYLIDGTSQQTITLVPSVTYRLDVSDSSVSNHPLRLSTTSNGTHNSGSQYTTGFTVVGTAGQSGAHIQVKLEQDAPALYYYCGNHSGMGGSISMGGTSYSVGDGGLTEKNFTTALSNKLNGIAASANNFVLPTATASALGGIKIGTGLSIDSSGVVTASGASASGGTLDPVKQTEFTGAATSTFSVTYQAGNISVFLNGAKLAAADIAAATNGTSVQLASAVAASDVVTVVEYGAPFAANYASNIYTATAGQTTQAVTVTPDKCAVYVNGVKILLTTDYSVNAAGTTITFVNALAAGDMIEVVEHGALAAFGSSVTVYDNYSNLPSSGNTDGDMGWVKDVSGSGATKALYVWDGSEWDRVYSDAQEGPAFTTSPSSSYDLTGGANTDVTVAASDPDGFPIEYSVVTNPTSQAQATITQPSTGVFRFAASNTASNAGSFTAKFIANDGTQLVTASSSISLGFPYSIEYLLVGGGGSGGTGSNTAGSGGGAAGAFLTNTTSINGGTAYQIVIGEGGVDTGSGGGDDGSPTTAFGITAGGGGHGGTAANSAGNDGSNGSNNSSGGGSSAYSSTGGSGNGTGNNGGNSSSSDYAGSGGGGSGSVGVNANGLTAGNGGSGAASSITGSSITYAAGGGGGNRNHPSGTGAGQGGHSSAGDGSSWAANGSAGGRGTNATANSGSGGGGSVGPFSNLGGDGGSGIAVIKVLTSDYSGTTTGSPTITTSGSHTIIKFTASGSYTA